ncbi:Aste57867_9966 [Aphanomyces stellatus]|uniref:Aste57867_9966 protein n=1 Tax=Aphanomyces stellatus TaxID=120398 RepID=A0A485KP68_9STRA|nr:hypothetical protein As57867_009927 [Aphanomyces stellatus]VFT86844.1 Aste57867_9966 [Aphanomyces stellatus]
MFKSIDPLQPEEVTGTLTTSEGVSCHSYPEEYNYYEVLSDNDTEDDSLDSAPAPFTVMVASNANLYAMFGSSRAMLHAHDTNTNPLYLAPFLDAAIPSNFDLLRAKVPDHALQRFIQLNATTDHYKACTQAQAAANLPQPLWAHLWPNHASSSSPHSDIIKSLVTTPEDMNLVKSTALFCLFLQINQPEVYFNALKVSALAIKAFVAHNHAPIVATIHLAPHFLWCDATLCALAASDIGTYLLSCTTVPESVSVAIMTLATLHPLSTPTMTCYRA